MALLDFIRKKVKKGTAEILEEIRKEVSHKINLEIAYMQRRIVRELISITVLLASIIFLVISAAYFLIEYFMLSKTLAFLIVGIILLLVGIILRIIK